MNIKIIIKCIFQTTCTRPHTHTHAHAHSPDSYQCWPRAQSGMINIWGDQPFSINSLQLRSRAFTRNGVVISDGQQGRPCGASRCRHSSSLHAPPEPWWWHSGNGSWCEPCGSCSCVGSITRLRTHILIFTLTRDSPRTEASEWIRKK